jgi:hypothetical protein
MAYSLINTDDGPFAFDWDCVTRIIRSWVRAGSQLDNARTVTESQIGLNPFSWGLPDLQSVEVDWDKVRDKTKTGTWFHSLRLANLAYHSPDNLAGELKVMQLETRRFQNEFKNMMKATTQASLAAIDQSVSSYKTMIDVAKWVRDISGAVLMGISTAGIGTATGLTAGALGTGIKTYGKYEDTGSIGSATIEAAQNIVFIVVPAARGAQLTADEKVVKVIVCAEADTAKGLIEGKSVTEAVLSGSVQLGLPLVGKVFDSEQVKDALNNTAVPIVTKLVAGQAEVLTAVPGKVSQKVAEEILKKTSRAVIAKMVSPGQAKALAVNGDDYAEDSIGGFITFEEDFLVKFAIVEMTKGVGGSTW